MWCKMWMTFTVGWIKHIVQFMESFQDDQSVYMILALSRNNTLRRYVKPHGTVSICECRQFLSQISMGAQFIHERKYIHRDLKLSNVLIDHNMQMKICGFSLIVHADDPILDNKRICGTTNYLAPEVISRKRFVCGSDVWAIGVITFVLLSGIKPFADVDAYKTHRRILRAAYRFDWFECKKIFLLLPNIPWICRVPSLWDDVELHSFFRSPFQRNVQIRPTAEQCLKLEFLKATEDISENYVW